MKNLLLLLILANILYLMWGVFKPQESNPSVTIVQEADLGPPLDVTTSQDGDAIASVGAVLGSGEPSDLEAVVGRSCVSIGPFKVIGDADSAVLEYNKEGMKAALRSGQGQIFVGHSVQVLNVPSRDAGRAMLGRLAEAGLVDAFIVGNEEDGLAISLGIFGNADNAEKIELQAESAGFEVDISPMTRDGTIYFVDIGLPPGKGAGAIIEKYGEARVALRDAATCPQ
ncbi:MAG: hypothetical protein WBM57_00700 [Woeseiaceae bacterium]